MERNAHRTLSAPPYAPSFLFLIFLYRTNRRRVSLPAASEITQSRGLSRHGLEERSMKRRIASALLAASLLFAYASAVLAWENGISGTRKMSRASAFDVKTDSSGNIVVAGDTDGQVRFTADFTVMKLSGAG